MERAGISGEVAHTALEDALVVVKLIRHKML
jgi:DNA polymerase III epsilon subunit-like protein